MHGTLYDFIRDDRFNAANALSGTTLPMDQQQYGGSLGGPVVRDRTFYFANVEQRVLDQTGLVTIPQQNVAVINAKLNAVGYQGGEVTTGVYPNPLAQHYRARQARSAGERIRSVQRAMDYRVRPTTRAAPAPSMPRLRPPASTTWITRSRSATRGRSRTGP
jgi:hypothetical protein